MTLLLLLVILLSLIVIIGMVNTKFFKMPADIALVAFSLVIGIILVAPEHFGWWDWDVEFITEVDIEHFLLEGVLCFMLFSGASKVHFSKFLSNIKPIVLLALLTTLLSSTFYGLLFFLFAQIAHLPMDFWTCVLLGCIVSPTDPIAATSILNKLGLSKSVTSVIEGESLFNDGTGVVLFVFVKSMVGAGAQENFIVLLGKEVLGAFAVGFGISFLTFELYKRTKDPVQQIMISLVNVASVYVLCEHCGFSGILASVVCGMFYAFRCERIKREREVYDHNHLYQEFWDIIDTLLNSILFVLLGITAFSHEFSEYAIILIPASILISLCARLFGVTASSLIVGRNRLPSNYSLVEFVSLMTWSALRGGLSLALVLGCKEFLAADVYLILLNVTYLTVFFTILVQGLTTGKVYRIIEKQKLKRNIEERKQHQAVQGKTITED